MLFCLFICLRDMLSKIKEVEYREVKIQDYLTDKMFNRSERKLLYALRSRCYTAKQNFKSLYKNNMSCRFWLSGERKSRTQFNLLHTSECDQCTSIKFVLRGQFKEFELFSE